jgi:hypothetical protein
MRATLQLDDLTTFHSSDVSFWALNPKYEDGDISISADIVDNEDNHTTLEFVLRNGDLLDMLDAIKKFKERK